MRAARALAAFEGAKRVTEDHLKRMAAPSLRHRLRRNPLDETGSTTRITRAVSGGAGRVSPRCRPRLRPACALDRRGAEGRGAQGPGGRRATLARRASAHLLRDGVYRVPPHVGMDRLTGGIDVAATLRSGTPRYDKGLLAEADGGVLLLTSAERLAPDKAALIAAAMDQGARASPSSPATRASRTSARPSILSERVAFLLDITALRAHGARPLDLAAARRLLAGVDRRPTTSPKACARPRWRSASPPSARPSWRCAPPAPPPPSTGARRWTRTTRALAARLVLAPRAVTYPAPPEAEDEPQPPAARRTSRRPTTTTTASPPRRNSPTCCSRR